MKPIAPQQYPSSLAPRLASLQQRISELSIVWPPDIAATALQVGLASEFVFAVLMRYPDQLVARLEDRTALSEPLLRAAVDLEEAAEADAMAALRRLRQIELARIAWRDIVGWANLDTSLAELSTLADGMVKIAHDYAVESLRPRFGLPTTRDGRPAGLLVLAMGKLGGRELNYSSDIDLVFLHPDSVLAEPGKPIEPERYYRQVGQMLIKLLNQVTADGFVFRVDMRLRPFGDSGPLVIGISAFESYLARHGRDWERYAYVKARLVTGEAYRKDIFDEILTPFVFRRYLDFGVFDALRQMKRLISQEVARKDMADNIKLGPGGVREIEFIVQVFQLVRGGREPELRSRSLLRSLAALEQHAQLGADALASLEGAYRYLRSVENRLQALDDRQTHDLPQDPEHRARLAYAMAETDWNTLLERLTVHRRAVEAEFKLVAWEAQSPRSEDEPREHLTEAWEAGKLEDSLEGGRLGQDEEALRLLTELRTGGLYQRMDEPSRQRLSRVVIRMLPLLEAASQPSAVLTRTLPVLRAICRRSAYLALLNENPEALKRLLSLAGQSPLLARQMAEHPLLLDELLDVRLFDAPPTRAELEQQLEHQIAAVPEGDVEASLEAMREFQRSAIFRIAVADRLGNLPLMKVSDRLTDTAELVLEFAYRIALGELSAKHGTPRCGDELRQAGFAVIAYGKLGGYELGYGSDLDLVFMHDSAGPKQETSGPNQIDNTRFFARLAQRLIHFLSIQTSSGRLYEVDTRLRPSGGSGLMVASLANFHRYQREDAWVWEHQALLRSRSVAGDPGVGAAFERERREILIKHVDRGKLRAEVQKMRARMRSQLSRGDADSFDIKQDAGGLADIEFVIDYWVLSNAPEYPELVTYPDNIRQLEALERVGLVSREDCGHLKDAYLALRGRLHELALNDEDRAVPATEFIDVRATVTAIWQQVFG